MICAKIPQGRLQLHPVFSHLFTYFNPGFPGELQNRLVFLKIIYKYQRRDAGNTFKHPVKMSNIIKTHPVGRCTYRFIITQAKYFTNFMNTHLI